MSSVNSLLSKLQPQMAVQVEMTSLPECTRFEERSTGRDGAGVQTELVKGKGSDHLLTR